MSTIAFSYGFAEGSKHAQSWQSIVGRSGLEATHDLSAADIIVAHSGGCYMLPKVMSSRFIVLIGVPCWVGRNILVSFIHKCVQDFASCAAAADYMRFCVKTMWNLIYGFGKAYKWPVMYYLYKSNRYPTTNTQTRVLVIHNTTDTFSNKHDVQKLATTRGWSVIEVPGSHDDLWTNPQTYVTLILDEYNKILAEARYTRPAI